MNMLNLKRPFSDWIGPQPDWDPDIVAALDDDFDLNDPSNQLADDFIVKANNYQDFEDCGRYKFKVSLEE